MYEITPEHAVTLCGANWCDWEDYSVPGNILFGYLSAARGISQPLAWAVGGYKEQSDLIQKGGKPNLSDLPSWLDNPGDKAAVDFGYKLYNDFSADGTDMTWDEFQGALTTDKLDSFQPPDTYPSQLPLPQPNVYPPGYFLNPYK